MNMPSQSKEENNGGIKNTATATLNDRTPLFVSIIALFVSGICAGLLIAVCLLVPELLDAKIQAGSADAKAVANLARSDSQVAKDTIDRWVLKQEIKPK